MADLKPVYYPYLRGKQNELLLLRDLAPQLRALRIHPIIEPVKEDVTALRRAIEALAAAEAPATVIVNPAVGERKARVFAPGDLPWTDHVRPAVLAHADTHVDGVLRVCAAFAAFDYAFVHCDFADPAELGKAIAGVPRPHIFVGDSASSNYRRRFTHRSLTVLVKDGFQRRAAGADYRNTERSRFGSFHLEFQELSADGFGDFLTIGQPWQDGGGPAYAVVLHLTHLVDEDLFVYHFVSDRFDTPVDPAGKFAEALTKALLWIDQDPESRSTPMVDELRRLDAAGHFPGLGYAKRLSMLRHIEVVSRLVRQLPV